jgi:DNA recombination protein RmuC
MELAMVLLGGLVVLLISLCVFVILRRPPTNLTAEFASLSMEALDRAQKTFLDLAETRFRTLIEGGNTDLLKKKDEIDLQVNQMKTELGKVSTLVIELEKQREGKFAELTTNLKNIGEQTTALTAATNNLKQVLSNPQTRGQWGERMAEDILRSVGLIEGVNYKKQTTLDDGRSRPDFTFLLPRNLNLNMDVKFPFDNYVRYVDSTSESDRERYRTDFLRDVRNRLREITTRDYINQTQPTVDCALFFIPNEGVFTFIRNEDPTMFDLALKDKVICCSPLTLFAVLAVIRQAVDNFALGQASNEMLLLMGQFKQQWEKFYQSIAVVEKRLFSTQRAFDDMSGTRWRALDRPLRQIDAIRQERGIAISSVDANMQGADSPIPEGGQHNGKGFLEEVQGLGGDDE